MAKKRNKYNIEFVDTSSNLAEGYIKKSEDSLEEMMNVKKREWKIGTAYYTMYQAVYALLMKSGIKCEVHKGTLTLLKEFFSEYFLPEDFELLDRAFEARKDATYYVNREISDEVLEEIVKKAPHILAKCKTILFKLDEKAINHIRDKIKDTWIKES